MVPSWPVFGDFLGPAFPASRAQRISDVHSEFAVRPHHVPKYGKQTSNLRPLRLGEEKKKKKKKKETG